MLSMTFYSDLPIDFEHKNYMLLHYLSEIDDSYSMLKLSPYLLYTEKLILELNSFNYNLDFFKKSLKKEIIGISIKGLIYKEMDDLKEMEEIKEIIDYSIPLLDSKIKLGYKLLNKYPQLLF